MRVLRRVLLPVSVGIAALFAFGCLSQQERTALLSASYPLQVDYSRSLEDSLLAGHYNWVSYQITPSNFPGNKTGGGMLSAFLVPLAPLASLDTFLHREAAEGLRLATLEELLAFGETYPDVQKKLPILALGSSVDLEVPTYEYVSGNGTMFAVVVRRVKRLYPFLSRGLSGRIVGIDWLDDPDGYGMYYACLVKPQSSAGSDTQVRELSQPTEELSK
jgi:hypothetical protein